MPNPTQVEYFPLLGGIDQASAPLAIQPGRLLGGNNFEISKSGKGYRYPEGYERYDGQVSPSEAVYTRINFEDGLDEITAGTTVTSDAGGSGATGVCIADAVVESGSYATNDAVGYVAILATSGTFLVTDSIKVGAAVYITTITKVHTAGAGAPDYDTGVAWNVLAIAEARGNITAVTGSGDILGVHRYKGTTYVFRNNAGGTATNMYKSSITGWTQVDLGSTLNFDAGTAAFAVGETVSGAGGASAVIQKVVVTSGSWSGSDAAGFLVVGTVTSGPFVNNEALTGSITGAATADGAEVANTLAPDGRYECINYNFGGHAGTLTMYGVSGVDQAFEYDGTGFAFISTGMTTDTPNHIAAHQNHLFLSFTGGSVQHSSLVSSPLTAPHVWSAVTGASEFGMGDEVTGLVNTAGETLTILAQNSTKILYGESLANWNLQDHSDTSGAVEWTVQKLNEPFYIDSEKVTSLRATQIYGGLSAAGISSDVQDFMKTNSGNEIASVINLEKSQYRVFYTNNNYLSMTITNEGLAGFMFGTLTDTPTCATHDEATGEVFFGSDDGFVYEMDKGTSHDGETFLAHIFLPFNFLRTPRQHKRFFKAIYELDAESATSIDFNFIPNYEYMNSNIPSAQKRTIAFSLGSGLWDTVNWDQFVWGGDTDTNREPESYIDGLASEMALIIYLESATQQPFAINGVFIEYSVLGKER